MSTRDDLAGVLADTINKQFKDMKVAYFLDGSDTTPTDIKDFISTGSTMLDLAIGGLVRLQTTLVPSPSVLTSSLPRLSLL